MTEIERAPKVLIELKPSSIGDVDGVGVFAVSKLGKGRWVAEGIAEHDYRRLVPWSFFRKLTKEVQEKVWAFCIGTPQGFIPPEGFNFNTLCIEWYFNHSCDGNLGFDDNGDFIAIRRVAKGEELVYDYALAESNPTFRMVCKCRSKNCRKIITGNDWKTPAFRRKNARFMLPRLRYEPSLSR